MKKKTNASVAYKSTFALHCATINAFFKPHAIVVVRTEKNIMMQLMVKIFQGTRVTAFAVSSARFALHFLRYLFSLADGSAHT